MAVRIVVMGVSGCGKSTLGAALAARLGLRFVEGDSLHPAENVARMQAGIALSDADRLPFLTRVGEVLGAADDGVVVSCSALKRVYRDLLRRHAPGVRFVLPVIGREALLARMQQRPGHFMPPSLLDSQLLTLEMPEADEACLILDGTLELAAQVDQVAVKVNGFVEFIGENNR